ncbi:hypothetical protein EDB84DRAFT_1628850 [Lactarius hengduanensis]|nr:hypothetical protein EDB84DRAFT_1628850 [Lactarius hengduanensis]
MPKTTQSPSKNKKCPICHTRYRVQGYPAHVKKCEREREERRGEKRYATALEKRLRALDTLATGPISAAIPDELLPRTFTAAEPMDLDVGWGTSESVREPTPSPVARTTGSSDNLRTCKFTVEYHPNSGRVSEPPSDEPNNKRRRTDPPPYKKEPWRPFFQTREDFVFSEVVGTCIDGKGSLTLLTYSDMMGAWERASSQLTPFVFDNISVPYKGEDKTFEVPHRPLWDWAVDLILDQQLAPHFEWDAQKIFKHEEETTTRVYNEPWTADAFWNFQSQIPKGARPLCFILYADTSKLSSFGTEKAYPVVARCANLPVEIRNSNGVGGGRVIGWLPIVPENPEDENNPLFVNFKREVWHRAFYRVIRSIIDKSKTGCWLQCADGTQQLFFPGIIILSADYEEQCVMSLIRGYRGKMPCPICLVPNDKLADISTTWPLRTAAGMEEIVVHGRTLNKNIREKLLSRYGLRDINNVFWLVKNSDPYRALSFDRLHSNNSGLFGYHLWGEFKALAQTWRGAASKVDRQFNLTPRWRGLNHFSAVIKVSFTDGAKFEDISKVVIFAAHNVVPQDNKEGWQLLYCIRSFSILDLLLSLEVHTEKTILAGRNELKKFVDLMKKYILLCSESAEDGEKVKDWNFPKMHALVHSFDDIEAKGASRNYNTKPNEKLHGPLRKLYLTRTNFKNVASQILKYEHFAFISALIRDQIDELDAATRLDVQMMMGDDDMAGDREALGSTQEQDIDSSLGPTVTVHDGSSRQRRSKTFDAGAVVLRSEQPPVAFKSLEGSNQAENPNTFRNFRARLAAWLTASLPQYEFSLAPGCTRVEFQDDDKITEYMSIKVCYESKVDWQQYLDYLYCNPDFHGHERRDVVIVMTTEGFIFAKLQFIFTASVAGKIFPICLVCPLDAPIGPPRAKDRNLRLRRLRARRSMEFFFAQSIVRGAPVIQDFDRHGDYFVMDVVDHSGDLFIRCNEIFGW